MKSLVFATLALLACSKSSDSPAPTAGSGSAGSGSAAAPLVIKPYTPAADVPQPIKDAIAAKDRTDNDRALDAGRKPGEMLAFFKIAPGQKVGEMFAGPGYTDELVARVVGDGGKVYAQNTKDIADKFARKPLAARASKHANIVVVEQPTEDPFPDAKGDLDAVICIINYHDFVWQKVDRDKMNKAVLAALKPGGVYGIVDTSAEKGSGTRDVDTLHRIDEEVVKQEVTAAGFKLDGESDALRNPDDKRDWNSSPKAAGERRGTADKFTLRFVKP